MSVNYEDTKPHVPPRGRQDPAVPGNVHDLDTRRANLDATLPPTPLKDLLASDGASVFILSTDEKLIDVVERAGGEQYPIFAVDSWELLLAAVDSGRCGIALLDAELLRGSLEEHIAALGRYQNRLVTLVAANRADAEQLIGMLSERRIHRLLIMPAAVGVTRLLLDSAVTRRLKLRELVESDPVPTLDVASPVAESAVERPARRFRIGSMVLVALIAVLAGGGLARWFWTVPGAESPQSPAPSATAVPDPYAGLLARAHQAFVEGRLAEPAGDSALDYYLTIVAADPDHREAHEQLSVVVDALYTQAEMALLAGSLDAAATVLGHIRRADAGSPRLAFLENQLELAREHAKSAAAAAPAPTATAAPAAPKSPPAAAAEAHPQTAETHPPTELESLLTLAAARIKQGDLLEPMGDSAREYLQRASALQPQDPRVDRVRTELASAVAAAAQLVLDNGDLGKTAELLTAARDLGADRETVAALDGEMHSAMQERDALRQSSLLTSAVDRLQQGLLISPAGDSAADYLTALREQNPTFPGAADRWTELTAKLAAKTRTAIGARDWTEAANWLAAIARLEPDSALVKQLTKERDVARLREKYLAEPVPASQLKVIEYQPPDYPPDALREQVEGSVELQFIVTEDGHTRDLKVVNSEPAGRFDQAALDAVSRYRFAPFVKDGYTFERRARLKLRFTLK